jgi:DNA polymerase-4
VAHRDFGHGWVQGAGHGVVTARFETRSSGPGPARTFSADGGDLVRANPVDSLDWPDYVGGLQASEVNALSAPPGEDVGGR